MNRAAAEKPESDWSKFHMFLAAADQFLHAMASPILILHIHAFAKFLKGRERQVHKLFSSCV